MLAPCPWPSVACEDASFTGGPEWELCPRPWTMPKPHRVRPGHPPGRTPGVPTPEASFSLCCQPEPEMVIASHHLAFPRDAGAQAAGGSEGLGADLGPSERVHPTMLGPLGEDIRIRLSRADAGPSTLVPFMSV